MRKKHFFLKSSLAFLLTFSLSAGNLSFVGASDFSSGNTALETDKFTSGVSTDETEPTFSE